MNTLVDPLNRFNFCPNCGANLIKRERKVVCADCYYELFINPAPRISLLIVNNSNEILMIRRKTIPYKKHWDLPEVYIKENESIEEVIKNILKIIFPSLHKKFQYFGSFDEEFHVDEIKNYAVNIVFKIKLSKVDLLRLEDSNYPEYYRFFNKDDVLWNKVGYQSTRKIIELYFQNFHN